MTDRVRPMADHGRRQYLAVSRAVVSLCADPFVASRWLMQCATASPAGRTPEGPTISGRVLGEEQEDRGRALTDHGCPAGSARAAGGNDSSYSRRLTVRVAEPKWRRGRPNGCSDRPGQFGRRASILDQARSGDRIHSTPTEVPQVRRSAEPSRRGAQIGQSVNSRARALQPPAAGSARPRDGRRSHFIPLPDDEWSTALSN